MRRLVITAIVLVGVLVAADFGAAAVFEYQVSKRARQQFTLSDDPSVTVGGFPFMTQAIGGTYDHVTIDAKGVQIPDSLQDVEIHADLLGVQAPLSDLLSGKASVKVDEVLGQVKVKAADVNRVIQQKHAPGLSDITNLRIDPVSEREVAKSSDEDTTATDEQPAKETEDTDAGVKLCGTIDFGDQNNEVCVFAMIRLSGGGIEVEPRRVDVSNNIMNGTLPTEAAQRILGVFAIKLEPGQLPFKIAATAVRVEPGILSVTGKAQKVQLTGGGA